MGQRMGELSWVGSWERYLDHLKPSAFENMVIGRYGGNSLAGADKNEDGLFILIGPGRTWEFSMLLDAHNTAESAELLIRITGSISGDIEQCLSRPVHQAFKDLETLLLTTLGSDDFRSRCREVTGETACLICVRKESYLWWFSVGDNSVYLLHPELAARGQYLLNQRNYYEWIGYVNTFDQPVACFSSGVRELRKGRNVIVMTTDGLLEYGRLEHGKQTFEDPGKLYETFYNEKNLQACVEAAILEVHEAQGRDSATVIAWSYYNERAAVMPSDAK
ncbi:protein phosphatase 2C domain-containing protein [Paenibacillus ihuae]|uniref:protein phosphatase 2C domain-containing protein n=1 Tax=Paenibacillus ihuae TaxID=1232431 RepID=UPI0006D5B679|nr:protein phosphatase 2C domain-containing protein [Paenibacillus ihuae]